METALCQEAEDDTTGWSSDNSSEHDYPGAQRVNVGQLWDEHRMFLAALSSYIEYGGVQSRIYHCPCSRGVTEWRRRFDLEIPPLVKYKSQFTQLFALMQHFNSKNGVYH